MTVIVFGNLLGTCHFEPVSGLLQWWGFPCEFCDSRKFHWQILQWDWYCLCKNTICMKQTPYQFNKIVLTDSYCNEHVPVLQMIIQFVWGKNPKFITWLLIYPRLTNYYYSKNTLFMNYSNEVIKINICTWTIIHTDVKNMTTGALRYSCCSVWWEWEFPSIAVWRSANPWSPGWSGDRQSSSPVCTS